ncbi:hypothetical protein LSH36_32g09059 [Paralvinella palmiformis]|uniref:Uncharacterized protein n=1 Tax=Paralvinella palmiformis TaxID=53620 RepID=A0AAD9K9M2_9ANNE|nr:hypothetical protein LSH36_32g09059 [Paralvinella palmiformis]
MFVCSFNIPVKHLGLLWLYSVFMNAHCDNIYSFVNINACNFSYDWATGYL